ncbi:MAG: hypothetical protein IPG61_10025 [bacterium]|nr:hypothetical protein [bacterium]
MPVLPRQRLLTTLLVLWAFAFTSWRALRGPNDFALAHWLLDYRLGFIKRGLLGSFTSAATAGRPTESGLVIASFVLFMISSAALLYALLQLAARGRSAGATLLALVLAGSPLVVMHAHLVGYLDGVVIAMTVGAVALALRGRTAAGAVIMAVSVLVHETTLVVGLPAFLFAAHRRGGNLRRALAPSLGVFALVAAAQALQSATVVREAITLRLAPVPWLDAVIRESLPVWLTDSFLENLRQCADGLWSRALWAVAPVLVAPTALAAFGQAWPALGSRRDAAFFAAVCAVPQVTHLFAWDGPRLWTWSLFAALLAAWVVAATAAAPVRGDEAAASRWGRPLGLAFLAVLLLNLWFTIPLMDGQFDHLARSQRLLLHLPVLAYASFRAWRRPSGAVAEIRVF